MALQTYTSPFGTTPQATNLSSLLTSLGNIKGMTPQAAPAAEQATQMQANKSQWQQNLTAGQQQQAGLPGQTQNYADESKMLAMFAHDQNLSQQYTRPDMQGAAPTQQASDVPTFGRVGTPQTPVLTAQSLNQPFSGLTTPGAVNSAISNQGTSYGNALDLISKAIQFNSGQVASNVSKGTSDYADATQALMSIANLLNASNASSGTGSSQATLDSLKGDAEKLVTLEDLMKKYSGVNGITADDIYKVYSQYNYNDTSGKQFGYGPAKQSAQQLANMGVTGAPLTTKTAGNWKKTTTGGIKIAGNTIAGQDVYQNSKSGVSLPITNNKVHLVDPSSGSVKEYDLGDPEIDTDLANGWNPVQ